MKIQAILLIVLALGSGCRKEKVNASWDTSLLFPIAKTTLAPGDLIPDSLLNTQSDQSLLLVYNSNVYSFRLSEIVDIPETTVVNFYSWPFANAVVQPGDPIMPTLEDSTTYALDGAGLRLAILRSGGLAFEVKSDAEEKTICTFKIPLARKNGQSFEAAVTVPAATSAGPGEIVGFFDLTGYEIDLTGKFQNRVNTFYTVTTLHADPDSPPVTIKTGNTFLANLTFKDILPEYVRGYFGQQEVNSGSGSSDFNLFSGIQNGSLSLEDVNVGLRVSNGIGADARFRLNFLNSIASSSVPLNHAVVGNWINLNRAQEQPGQAPPIIPSVQMFEFSQNNSNIKALIENLPNSLSYEAEASINPLGNVSGWNDFAHIDYGLDIDLEITMPLHFSASGIKLGDTIKYDPLSLEAIENVQDGNLLLHVDNWFPFRAKVDVVPEGDTLSLLSSSEIAAAIPASSGIVEEPVSSIITIPLTEDSKERLMRDGRLLITITLETQPAGVRQKIYSFYKMDLQLTADLRYRAGLR